MSKRDSTFHGLLIVNKPGRQQEKEARSLPTSHDIVQQVRRWSQQRRIGHTGTLDPMASGVLVLCLGTATRLVEYYQGHSKQYYAEIVLGASTDTYDAMGEVKNSSPIPSLDATQIEAALAQFRGEILQVPPIFSALKQGGESLHRKARRGEAVTIQPRSITIHDLSLVRYQPPERICLRITCSAGTYIRSLAHDIGLALQTDGHLDVLVREKAGSFSLEEAHTLAEIEEAFRQEPPASTLQPLGYGLQMPSLLLDDESMIRFGYGQKVVLPQVPEACFPQHIIDNNTLDNGETNQLVQAIDSTGQFVGILRCLEIRTSPSISGLWKAEKWFAVQAKDS